MIYYRIHPLRRHLLPSKQEMLLSLRAMLNIVPSVPRMKGMADQLRAVYRTQLQQLG